MHVFRAGESKSAVEPYLRDDMSENERGIVTRWLGGLWSAYTELAETSRELPKGEMDRFIASFGERLAASNNNLAETMLAGGWVDALADHAEMEVALAEWVGVTDEDGDAELGDVVEDRGADSPFEVAATALLPRGNCSPARPARRARARDPEAPLRSRPR